MDSGRNEEVNSGEASPSGVAVTTSNTVVLEEGELEKGSGERAGNESEDGRLSSFESAEENEN